MRLTKHHDNLWVSLVLNPTPAGFAEFYAATWTLLYAYIAEVLHNPDTIEEALQATYVVLWEALSSREAAVHNAIRPTKMGTAQGVGPLTIERSVPPTAEAALLRFGNREIDRIRKTFHRELNRRVELDRCPGIQDTCRLDQREHVVWEESVERIGGLLAGLPEELKIAFQLHYHEGLTHEEISARLGVERSVVTRRIQRALEAVRSGLFA